MFFTAFTVETILCLVCLTLCLMAAGILFSYSGSNKAGLSLGFSYLFFGLGFIVLMLTYSKLIFYVPHLYRTRNVFFLFYMPFSLLYVRLWITEKPVSPWHLLYFLPVLLYIVDYLPFFLSPATYKLKIIHCDLSGANPLMHSLSGWLMPARAETIIMTCQMMLCWILQVRLLLTQTAGCLWKDRSCLRWMILYNVLQLFIFLPLLIVSVINSPLHFWAASIPPAIAGILSASILFFNPRMLYGVKKKVLQPAVRAKAMLTVAFSQFLTMQLERVMREERPFLNANYTSKELAETLDIPLYKLSAYLNQVTGKNFSDFLNQFRITYCLELMRDKEISNLNLSGIATKCGFNNRNTFASAFKKFTGQTPSDYLHSIG